MDDDDNGDLKTRTFAYSRRIVHLFSSLPRETVAQVIGKQCLRSGTSIGANYREAYRARSKAEFIAKIGDCLKEAEETLYWLELMEAEQIVSPERLQNLLIETREIVAIFVSSLNTAKNNSS